MKEEAANGTQRRLRRQWYVMVVVTRTAARHTATQRGKGLKGRLGIGEKNIWMEIENGKVDKKRE